MITTLVDTVKDYLNPSHDGPDAGTHQIGGSPGPGYYFDEQAGAWRRGSGNGHHQDGIDRDAGIPGFVTVHDHSRSNPENWSPQQWIDAIKENPEKYGRLFSELSATGKLTQETKDAKKDITLVVQEALQERSEGFQMRSNLAAALHAMSMAAINNIRA